MASRPLNAMFCQHFFNPHRVTLRIRLYVQSSSYPINRDWIFTWEKHRFRGELRRKYRRFTWKITWKQVLHFSNFLLRGMPKTLKNVWISSVVSSTMKLTTSTRIISIISTKYITFAQTAFVRDFPVTYSPKKLCNDSTFHFK